MAVHKKNVTPSKRGKRRSHDALTAAPLSVDKETGATHRRHHIALNGHYRGRKVLVTKRDRVADEEE